MRLVGLARIALLDTEGVEMAKFLVRANYTGDGVKGLINEGGSKRRDAATAAIESVGGTLECMYYAFGDTDVYAICDMPDNASAAAVSLLINASGAVSLNLTPLMTPEDVDAAVAKTPSYRAPGT
jgi:uncharacterized protein with GYD domain